MENGRLLSVASVAGLLDCSVKTVYRLVEVGHLDPPVKLLGENRWPAEAVERFRQRLIHGALPPPKKAEKKPKRGE